jgi:hypothetical protein
MQLFCERWSKTASCAGPKRVTRDHIGFLRCGASIHSGGHRGKAPVPPPPPARAVGPVTRERDTGGWAACDGMPRRGREGWFWVLGVVCSGRGKRNGARRTEFLERQPITIGKREDEREVDPWGIWSE